MKNTFIVLLLIMTFSAAAQNTFPVHGNVGVGTTSPNSNLHIKNSRASLFIENTNATDWTYIRMKGSASNFWDIGQYGNNDYLEFRPRGSSANRIVFKQNGNVGIGTSTPTSKLQILQASNTYWAAIISNVGGVGKGLKIKNASGGITPSLLIEDNNGNSRFLVQSDGNIGIGTSTPDSKLTVAGNIHSREVKVTINAGADFVFEKDYNLPSLEFIEGYVAKNKHLPGIASEKEMQGNGLLLAEMNIKLLQKIEELTLYTIAQGKEIKKINKQAKKMDLLEKENKKLSDRLERIEELLRTAN